MALYQIARLLLSGCALCIPWDTQEPIHKMLQRLKFKKIIMAFWDVLFEDEQFSFQFQVMTGLLLSVLLYGGCPRHALSCCSHWNRMEAICCLLRKTSSLVEISSESWAFFNFMQMRAICCLLRANQFDVCVIWKPT